SHLLRDGDRLFTSRADDDGVWWHDVVSGKDAGRLKVPEHGRSSCVLSPNRKLAATFSIESGDVSLWDLSTGKAAGTLEGDNFLCLSATFTHDGKGLWVGDTDGKRGHVRLWDVGRKTLVRKLPAGRGAAYALAVSDDGKTLAVAHSPCDFFQWGDEEQT